MKLVQFEELMRNEMCHISYLALLRSYDFAYLYSGWLSSQVVSMLNSGAEGSGFKLQSQRSQVTVLGKLFTPIVPLFTKQRNW